MRALHEVGGAGINPQNGECWTLMLRTLHLRFSLVLGLYIVLYISSMEVTNLFIFYVSVKPLIDIHVSVNA
jgi:hypothetical protein